MLEHRLHAELPESMMRAYGRLRWTVMAATMLVSVVASGGHVRASHSEPAGIHVCLKEKAVEGGTTWKLKQFVDDPATCKPGKEVVKSWNEPGAPGAGVGRLGFSRSAVAAAGQHAAITIGLDGNPVASYYRADTGDLNVFACNDSACVGGDETVSTVDTGGPYYGQYTSIAIGSDGNPVISYYHVSDGGLRVARCNDRACAGGGETLSTVDTVGDVGSYSSIAVGTTGNPVVSYYDATNGNLKVVGCNDPACTGGDDVGNLVDGVLDNVGQHTSITIGTDGNPTVSYHDVDAAALVVTHCNDPACAGGDETPATVDAGPSLGQYTSITVGLDGFPVVSYYDQGNGDLKVARCNDPACVPTGETLTTVDSGGDVGLHSSIVLGVDGNPVVSYFDETNDDLKVTRCNDLACAGANETTTTVDSSGLVGSFASITIGVDRYPVIAYSDTTNAFVKVLHCSNIACTPLFRNR